MDINMIKNVVIKLNMNDRNFSQYHEWIEFGIYTRFVIRHQDDEGMIHALRIY